MRSDTLAVMSTKDQTHSARLHGEALVAAEKIVLESAYADIIAALAAATDNPQERAQVAGHLAGDAIAKLGQGGQDLAYALIAAGLLLESGIVDHDQLGPAVREAYDRARDQPSSL